MLTRYDAVIRRLAGYRSLLLFLVLFAFFGGGIMPYFGTMLNEKVGQEVQILDLIFGFAPEDVYDHLSSYGEAGRPFYLILELTLDMVYPVVYTLFLGIALYRIFRRDTAENPLGNFHRAPLLVILFDYLENLNVVALLTWYPTEVYGLAVLCSVLTLLKWGSLGIVLMLALHGLIRNLQGLLNTE